MRKHEGMEQVLGSRESASPHSVRMRAPGPIMWDREKEKELQAASIHAMHLGIRPWRNPAPPVACVSKSTEMHRSRHWFDTSGYLAVRCWGERKSMNISPMHTGSLDLKCCGPLSGSKMPGGAMNIQIMMLENTLWRHDHLWIRQP